jgi:hypothetical protein
MKKFSSRAEVLYFLVDTAHKKILRLGLKKMSGSSQREKKLSLLLAESFIFTLTHRFVMCLFATAINCYVTSVSLYFPQKVKLSLCYAMKAYGGVVNFTPCPLYPRGKSPRYPLDRRLGGSQSQSGRFGEEKILDAIGTRTPTPQSSRP